MKKRKVSEGRTKKLGLEDEEYKPSSEKVRR